MRNQAVSRVVSFSGIDGAGKSTQILELQDWLKRGGLTSSLITFWDDVVVLSGLRERMSHRVFKGDQGIGSPEKPLTRRDKNVTSWPVTALRFFFYLADAISLLFRVAAARRRDHDVVIFDRYIYDELANLPLEVSLARAFAWTVMKLAPFPDIAFVIDAHPAEARARKPEYPLEFIRHNREAYLTLAKLAGNITIIEPGSIAAVQSQIREQMLQTFSGPEEGLALQ